MAGGAALITGLTGAAGAGAATLGGRVSGFTVARVAADAVRLHVVTQLVLRDVDGNEEAAKAVIVSFRERVDSLGKIVVALSERIEQLRIQLETKQAEVDAEREKRWTPRTASRVFAL
jgi:proteasome assembly chaperone (PAC2) family protein